MAVAPIDLRDVAERRVAERRADAPRIATADVLRRMPPRRERRSAHPFRQADGPGEGLVADLACVTCGYGESGHLALTDREQVVVTALLNQRQPPVLMRRSILRKLTSRLHILR